MPSTLRTWYVLTWAAVRGSLSQTTRSHWRNEEARDRTVPGLEPLELSEKKKQSHIENSEWTGTDTQMQNCTYRLSKFSNAWLSSGCEPY